MRDEAREDNRRFHIHLVSDATGETINSVARACLVQFEGIDPLEHTWTLIRTPGQMDKVLAAIAASPGIVLFTMVNEDLRNQLREGCRKLQAPCIPVRWQTSSDCRPAAVRAASTNSMPNISPGSMP